jgi:hypothetical protein
MPFMTRTSVHVGARFAAPLLALAVAMSAGAAAPKFYPDDPISHIEDSQDASNVKERDIDLIVDTFENSFYWPGDRTRDVRAQNLNTLDEVPDSNWFTNRLGARSVTVDELLKGPDTGPGPRSGRWTVVAAKNDGVSPGFTIEDSSGQVWFIKFDPPGYRAMATGTEMVVAKLFWALGYHVPEVHLATLRPDQLTIGEAAKVTTPNDSRRPFKTSDIQALLAKAHREPGGSYRVIASKALDGRPVGGFLFYGRRADDPNDIVAHEHRRELRAYGTFSAWLNHVDSKSINTLDTVVQQDGHQVIRHHLLDFGSTIGSAGVYPREAFEGWEYLVEGTKTLAGIPTFGFYIKNWRTIPMYRARSVGAFPEDHSDWDPEKWKPRYANSAFRSARLDDKFWAAGRLWRFTDEMLTAVVGVGQFGDPASEAMLARFLIDRRDAIVRRYLGAVNPIVGVALSPESLRFRNAAVDAGIASDAAEYVAHWMQFDNVSGATREIGTTSAAGHTVAAPRDLPSEAGSFIRVDIAAKGGPASWAAPVHAYFVREAAGWRLVGFERMPGGNQPREARRQSNFTPRNQPASGSNR